jgi:hypothetical protein
MKVLFMMILFISHSLVGFLLEQIELPLGFLPLLSQSGFKALLLYLIEHFKLAERFFRFELDLS